MKIAAKIDDEKFLVEIDQHEIANLIGFSSYYSMKEAQKYLRVGHTYNVGKMYNNICNIEKMKGQLETLKRNLEDITTEVSSLLPNVEEVQKEVLTKNPQ